MRSERWPQKTSVPSTASRCVWQSTPGTQTSATATILGRPSTALLDCSPWGTADKSLVSGVSADLVQGQMPPEATLADLGAHRLKDLSRPEQVYQLLSPDLPRGVSPHSGRWMHCRTICPSNSPHSSGATPKSAKSRRSLQSIVS